MTSGDKSSRSEPERSISGVEGLCPILARLPAHSSLSRQQGIKCGESSSVPP
jgi:hypothetical protein